MICAKTGSIDAVRALIADDVSVNSSEPVEHQTALMWAAEERHRVGEAVIAEMGHVEDDLRLVHLGK